MVEDMVKPDAELSDEALIEVFRKGDNSAQDFLIDKYKSLVKFKTREYFIIGADREDIIQEGMIGLHKAIRDYKPERNVPFYYFAQLCINRQILSAIKAAARQKHSPLNTYVSLNKSIDEESEKSYIENLSELKATDPEELFIGKEDRYYIEMNMGRLLSEMERRVLSLYLQGLSYAYIAKLVSKEEKSVDNAIQRARRKIDKFLRQRP